MAWANWTVGSFLNGPVKAEAMQRFPDFQRYPSAQEWFSNTLFRTCKDGSLHATIKPVPYERG